MQLVLLLIGISFDGLSVNRGSNRMAQSANKVFGSIRPQQHAARDSELFLREAIIGLADV